MNSSGGRSSSFSLVEEIIPHYRFRVVTEWNHLIEKIAVFDAALDDFVFEAVKTGIWVTHSKSNTLAPDTFLLEQATRNSQGELIYSFVDTLESATTSLEVNDSGIYQKLYETIYTERAVEPFPNGEWLIVNQQTASDRLKAFRTRRGAN
ncbi:MAG: CpXC domain-containing protein [Verrucomicrobia bacterium]|nr:CpXC domain-containing protein [Verrucomicrobiota bacterium]